MQVEFGQIQIKNPVLKNVTDYLIDEGDFEEEELLGKYLWYEELLGKKLQYDALLGKYLLYEELLGKKNFNMINF